MNTIEMNNEEIHECRKELATLREFLSANGVGNDIRLRMGIIIEKLSECYVWQDDISATDMAWDRAQEKMARNSEAADYAASVEAQIRLGVLKAAAGALSLSAFDLIGSDDALREAWSEHCEALAEYGRED